MLNRKGGDSFLASWDALFDVSVPSVSPPCNSRLSRLLLTRINEKRRSEAMAARLKSPVLPLLHSIVSQVAPQTRALLIQSQDCQLAHALAGAIRDAPKPRRFKLHWEPYCFEELAAERKSAGRRSSRPYVFMHGTTSMTWFGSPQALTTPCAHDPPVQHSGGQNEFWQWWNISASFLHGNGGVADIGVEAFTLHSGDSNSGMIPSSGDVSREEKEWMRRQKSESLGIGQ